MVKTRNGRRDKINRREFLGALGLGAIAAGCRFPPGGPETRFRLAMAGYTLNRFKTDDALAFCERHGFRNLCVKSFHLPYAATPAEIAAFRAKCADRGVTPYAVGPITFMSDDEPRKYFDYAATLGVDLIVGVPGRQVGKGWKGMHSDRSTCEKCSTLADEYRMRFAIHNHGRNPETGVPTLYPAVPETYELIRDLSPRMGFCVDWAYTFADGLDCREIAFKYRDRIFDGHVRCLAGTNNGSVSTSPAKRCFDYDGIFDALREIGYCGCLGLECADAFSQKHPEWIDESRDYFEGLM